MLYQLLSAFAVTTLAVESSIVHLHRCSDGKSNFNILCAPALAWVDDTIPEVSEVYSEIPISTQSDTTKLNLPHLANESSLVEGFLVMQPEHGAEWDPVSIPTKLHLSPFVLKEREALGLGYMSPIVFGDSATVSNFAISGTRMILNSANQARNFCHDEDMRIVPVHASTSWSVRIVDNVFKIDSGSDIDVVPRVFYNQITEMISRVENVTIIGESTTVGHRALIRNCESNIGSFPVLRYPIMDGVGNTVFSLNIHPRDYLTVMKNAPATAGISRACKLQIAPSSRTQSFSLGMNLFKRTTVYFDRAASTIGFCETKI